MRGVSLLDRLRPRWQHSDPEERAAAVRELGDAAEDQEALAQIVRHDEDARVRRLAIKRITSAELLSDLAATEPDAPLRELARERAAESFAARAKSEQPVNVCEEALGHITETKQLADIALTAFHSPLRRAALARVSDQRTLGDIARSTQDIEIARSALRRLHDVAVLRRVALSDGLSEAVLGALDRIEDPDTLHGIVVDGVAHKRIRQRAESRLAGMIDDDHPIRVRERQEAQRRLCVAAEELITAPDPASAATEIERVRAQWGALAERTAPIADLAHRFRSACDTVLAAAAHQQRLETEKHEWTASREANRARAIELCERVASLDAGARVELEAARREFDDLGPLPDDDAEALARRFTEASRHCQARIEAGEAAAAFRTRLEQLVEEAERLAESEDPAEAVSPLAALERRWKELSAEPGGGEAMEAHAELHRRLLAAGERLAARQQAQTEALARERDNHLAGVQQRLRRLQKLAGAEPLDLRQANRMLRELRTEGRIGPLPPGESRRHWQARLQEAEARLLARVHSVQESEDWRRWANAEVQEQLIQRAEALLQVQDLAEVAKQLRTLQEEWKPVAVAPRAQSEELWERFRQARNELRRRCDAHFKDNRRRKDALCAQVEALRESEDWGQTATAIKRMQEEWKTIGPVPHKVSQALWTRFRAACDHFFERRNAHFADQHREREENAAHKTALCERVEELAESTDWDRTAEEIKSLQVQWKRIGPSPRQQSDALWTRFRAACDRFFERRSRRGEVELEAKLEQAAAVCTDLEALRAAVTGDSPPPADAIGEQLRAALATWSGLGPLPGERANALLQRVRDACADVAAHHPESVRGTALDPGMARRRREKLCSRMEQLVETLAGSTKTLTIEGLAATLKERWAANTIAGGGRTRDEARVATREAERLKETWDRLGPLLGAGAEELAARFEKAYREIQRLRPAAKPRNPSR
jgi:hypothetical protein